MRTVSQALAGVGVLLIVYALVGRFVFLPTVFGGLLKGGLAAGTLAQAGNTLLLLALCADTLFKKPPSPQS